MICSRHASTSQQFAIDFKRRVQPGNNRHIWCDFTASHFTGSLSICSDNRRSARDEGDFARIAIDACRSICDGPAKVRNQIGICRTADLDLGHVPDTRANGFRAPGSEKKWDIRSRDPNAVSHHPRSERSSRRRLLLTGLTGVVSTPALPAAPLPVAPFRCRESPASFRAPHQGRRALGRLRR